MAMQRSDIAISRTSTASDRAQNADIAADKARIDCEIAVSMAREFAPDFKPSVLERFQKLFSRNYNKLGHLRGNSTLLPYDENSRSPDKSGFLMKEPDLNVSLRQQSDISSNSVLPQKLHVTPQTDFAHLVNQPNQSSNSSFAHIYPSYIKDKEEQSKQYQENVQQRDFIRKNEMQVGHLNQENSTSSYSNRMGKNDITGQNQTNYILNANSDQLDGYIYNNSERRTNLLQNNLTTNYSEQQKSVQQNSTQTFTQPLSNQSSQFYRTSPQKTEILGESRKPTRPPPLSDIDQQLSIDYFDHYKRPPSRDSSTDRYARAASHISSRQPSIDRSMPSQSRNIPSPNKEIRQRQGSHNLENVPRSITNKAMNNMSNQMLNAVEKRPSINQPFEDVLLYQRTLGQDIIPSATTPKRTESLYTPAKVIIPKGTPVHCHNNTGSKPVKNVLELSMIFVHYYLAIHLDYVGSECKPLESETKKKKKKFALNSNRHYCALNRFNAVVYDSSKHVESSLKGYLTTILPQDLLATFELYNICDRLWYGSDFFQFPQLFQFGIYKFIG
ncbi:putative uncharacterized protein DDB_G0282129 [Bactrocera oleae]|uniref:putative uncharacterized protein DDB_G0282129 n=1 Tax=Bactrocera oleae TaxID=104688 RepID=UPI00387E98CB